LSYHEIIEPYHSSRITSQILTLYRLTIEGNGSHTTIPEKLYFITCIYNVINWRRKYRIRCRIQKKINVTIQYVHCQHLNFIQKHSKNFISNRFCGNSHTFKFQIKLILRRFLHIQISYQIDFGFKTYNKPVNKFHIPNWGR
jgi:hypothetical protein